MRHLLSARELDRRDVDTILHEASGHGPGSIRPYGPGDCHVGLLFGAPSLRTRTSFLIAASRLGASVFTEDQLYDRSSLAKGETLEDTGTVLASMVDLLVLRGRAGDAVALARGANRGRSLYGWECPVVNAGDGCNEHPTQALLDLLAIQQLGGPGLSPLDELDGLKIALCGDLSRSRTVHSFLWLLRLYQNIQVIQAAPFGHALERDLVTQLRASGLSLTTADSLRLALETEPDIVYMIRPQREHDENRPSRGFSEANPTFVKPRSPADPPEPNWEDFSLRPEHLEKLKPSARVLHPLPRTGEIDPACDPDRRMIYFRQAALGVQLRMAVMRWCLAGRGES